MSAVSAPPPFTILLLSLQSKTQTALCSRNTYTKGPSSVNPLVSGSKLKTQASPGFTRKEEYPKMALRCNSSTGPIGPTSGNGDRKSILDAFFLGKALAEALNEWIESAVGEFLGTIGRLQAEQQKQIQEFQEDVFQRAKKAKEQSVRKSLEVRGLISKPITVDTHVVTDGASLASTNTVIPVADIDPSTTPDTETEVDPANKGALEAKGLISKPATEDANAVTKNVSPASSNTVIPTADTDHSTTPDTKTEEQAAQESLEAKGPVSMPTTVDTAVVPVSVSPASTNTVIPAADTDPSSALNTETGVDPGNKGALEAKGLISKPTIVDTNAVTENVSPASTYPVIPADSNPSTTPDTETDVDLPTKGPDLEPNDD